MFGLKTSAIGCWSSDVKYQVYLGISGNIVWIELTCKSKLFSVLGEFFKRCVPSHQ